jgi:hypothetical protein
VNGFLRNAYASAACVIANSFFIANVGSDHWPLLNFWIQSLTIGIFIAFIYAHDRRSYEIYALTLLAILLCSLGMYFDDSSTLFIYGLATFVITSDLLGGIVNNTLLAGIFSRPVLKELDQSVIPAELAGRLVGAGLIELVSRSGGSSHFHWLLWALVFAHLLCFAGIIRYWSTHNHFDVEQDEGLDDLGRVSMREVVTHALSSTVVQVSLLLMVWTQCVKFLTQALYYKAAEQLREGLQDTSQFLSQVNFATIAATYLFQQLIGKRMVHTKSMGYLFRVMPVGLAATGIIAFMASPHWIIVLQYVFYTVINKVINAPMTRQYIFLVPRQLRGKSYILITVITSVFLILTSWIAATLRDVLNVPQLMASLIIVSVLILISLSRVAVDETDR